MQDLDWNKTKTIFIVVFSILNVFLYSLYLNRHTEAQNIQVIGTTSIEDSLKMDDITFDSLPIYKKDSSHISAKTAEFTNEQVRKLENQTVGIINSTQIQSKLQTPVSIQNAKGDFTFTEFLSKYVLKGEEYGLWKVDKEEREATFFQKVNDGPIYFSPNAMLTVHFDEDGKATSYEQTMFDDFVSFNRKKDLLSPIEAIGSLYSRGYLKTGSTVKDVTFGYSILAQMPEIQLFAPTWHVRVELKNGEIEDHFINAIEGKIVEFQPDSLEDDHE